MDHIQREGDGGNVEQNLMLQQPGHPGLRVEQRRPHQDGSKIGPQVTQEATVGMAGNQQQDKRDRKTCMAQEYLECTAQFIVVHQGKHGAGQDFVDAEMRHDRVMHAIRRTEQGKRDEQGRNQQ